MGTHLQYRLVVRGQAGDKRVLPLADRPVRLGRSEDCDIRLDEAMVSRLHCVFGLAGGRPTVTDQGSANGTYVNGARVHHSWLEHDDVVVVGRTTIRVRAVELPPATATAPPPEAERPRPRDGPSAGPRRRAAGGARERLGLIYGLGALLASTVDEVTAAEAVLDLVLEALPVDRAFVLVARGSGLPEVVASRSRGGGPASGFPPSSHVVGEVRESGRAIIALDVAADPRLAARDSLAAAAARAVLCAPLLHGGGVLGLLYADSATKAEADLDEELALFEGIADQAALAIGRARLHRELLGERAALSEERDRLVGLRQSLEWRVREKTALAEAQAAELGVRLEELEQLAGARQTVARGLVHDIKDLVGAVVAGLEILSMDAEPGSREAVAAEGALEAADRIVALAEDVLAVSRMESGAYALDARRVAVADLVAATVRRLAVLAERRGVRLAGRVTEPGLTVTADPEVIGRILDNLVANGVRHAGEGGRVTVLAARTGRQVDLVVSDTGPGIAEADRERIFFEWSGAGGAHAGHHGIGLHYCRLAAEAHGGGIRVEGGAGDSRFVVSLPALPSSDAEEPTIDEPPGTDGALPPEEP